MGLAKSAAKGGAVIMVGQVVKIFLQLLNLVILARLLGPSEFGLVAMVLSVYGVGEVLRDFGLSSAAIQAKSISKAQVSNLFWINVLIGLIIALVGFVAADWVAVFYGRNELINIGHMMCLMFIFNGISAQYKAQLNRELKFKEMAVADVFGVCAGVGSGVVLAWQGYSYWSIVAQFLVQFFIQMLLYIYFGKWLPRLPNREVEMSHFFSFGWNLMGAQVLGYFSKSIPSILIGNKLGAVPLGVFDRAFQILMLPLNQLNAPSSSVALPVLSRLNNEDKEKYNNFVLFGQNVMVNIVVLFLALAATQTEQLVIEILGEKWIEITPVFRALCGAGAFLALSYASYWVFVSKGITSSLFKFTLVSRPILILISIAGINWGVEGVAMSYSIGLMINWLLGVFWLRNTGVPVRRMIMGPLGVVICYFSASAASYYMMSFFTFNGYISIIVGWLLLLIVLCFMYLVIPFFGHSINSLMSIRQYLRK
ncbi:MAG: lipopolysaccharide biosynthesis protein [Paraglaciecola chathamensis]